MQTGPISLLQFFLFPLNKKFTLIGLVGFVSFAVLLVRNVEADRPTWIARAIYQETQPRWMIIRTLTIQRSYPIETKKNHINHPITNNNNNNNNNHQSCSSITAADCQNLIGQAKLQCMTAAVANIENKLISQNQQYELFFNQLAASSSDRIHWSTVTLLMIVCLWFTVLIRCWCRSTFCRRRNSRTNRKRIISTYLAPSSSSSSYPGVVYAQLVPFEQQVSQQPPTKEKEEKEGDIDSRFLSSMSSGIVYPARIS